jgi:lysophospholipase L1-like esterase
MKQVILIGDSIRMGYQATVKEALAGEAEVWGPEQNGGNTRNVLAHLHEWALERGPDVVHVNAGLHDLRRDFGAEEAAVPLAEYADNVRHILEVVKTRTEAAVLWALTTPVNEARHHEVKDFDRLEADVSAYNEAAREAAEGLQVPLNDLWTVVEAAGRDALLLADGVHYTAEGYALLGRAVAGFVREHL